MSLAEPDRLMPALSGRRAWVVGCGFLGSCLLCAAREAGMQVLGLDVHPPAEVRGDAAEPDVLAAARSRLEPELIFCCVATHGGNEALYRATYLRVPQALHAACPGARILFCSSSSVYGGQGGEEVTETSPARAASPGARLLLEAEAAVQSMGGVAARLVPMYGEERCELLRRYYSLEPELPGEDSRWFNYVYREDAAQALLCLAAHLMEGSCPPLVNVSGETFTKGSVYEALSRRSGLPRIPARGSEKRRRTVCNHCVSSTLLRSLGWCPQMDFLRWVEERSSRVGGISDGFEPLAEPF